MSHIIIVYMRLMTLYLYQCQIRERNLNENECQKTLYVEALKWYSNNIKQESTKGIGKCGKILSAGD